MKKLFIILILMITFNRIYCQDYFVGFFGERPNLATPSYVGHAFIGIGKGTPLTCDIAGTQTEMYGFYPESHVAGGLSYFFGPVDGKIVSDVATQINTYYFKNIDFADYTKIQLKIENWKTKQYQVTRQDCISFFIDIASIFPDIVVPDRNTFVLPNDFVSQFIFLNNPYAIH